MTTEEQRRIFTKNLRRILDERGLQLSFHDLRHLSASVMLMLGVPEKYAMERGGWKTPHVMKAVYQHTSPRNGSASTPVSTTILRPSWPRTPSRFARKFERTPVSLGFRAFLREFDSHRLHHWPVLKKGRLCFFSKGRRGFAQLRMFGLRAAKSLKIGPEFEREFEREICRLTAVFG